MESCQSIQVQPLHVRDSNIHNSAIINQLNDEYYDLILQSQASISLHDIPAKLPSLSAAHMAQLARVQLLFAI